MARSALRERRALGVVGPFHSHLRALLEPVHAFQRCGFKTQVAAAPKLRRLIERRYGQEYTQVGTNWSALPGAADHLAYVLLNMGNAAFCRTVVDQYLCGPQLDGDADQLLALVERTKPEIIFSDITAFHAPVVAAFTGIPHLSFDNGWDRILRERVDALTASLPADRQPHELTTVEIASRQQTFTPAPPRLLAPDLDVIGYRHVNPPAAPQPLSPEWATGTDKRPLIYVSLGSILTNSRAFLPIIRDLYARVMEAIAPLACRAVFAVGPKLVDYFSPPSNAKVYAWVEQTEILKYASLFVTHTGYSSLREALAAGVRMLFLPISSDQPDNATRCVGHGLGFQISRDSSVTEIRAAIRATLYEKRIGAAASYWRDEMATVPKLEHSLRFFLPA